MKYDVVGVRPSTEPLWVGPYAVMRRTIYGPYILRSDTAQVYERRVPYDQMKVLYSATQIPKNRKDDEEDTYEVDYITQHREDNGVFKYQVKWKGYYVKEATWETEDKFNDPQPAERYFKLLTAKEKAKRTSLRASNDGTISVKRR